MNENRRFPPPWSIQENTESFAVKDDTGEVLCYVYFDDDYQRRRRPGECEGRCVPDRRGNRQAAERAAANLERNTAAKEFGCDRRLAEPLRPVDASAPAGGHSGPSLSAIVLSDRTAVRANSGE
jgi:hypothetical protein